MTLLNLAAGALPSKSEESISRTGGKAHCQF